MSFETYPINNQKTKELLLIDKIKQLEEKNRVLESKLESLGSFLTESHSESKKMKDVIGQLIFAINCKDVGFQGTNINPKNLYFDLGLGCPFNY